MFESCDIRQGGTYYPWIVPIFCKHYKCVFIFGSVLWNKQELCIYIGFHYPTDLLKKSLKYAIWKKTDNFWHTSVYIHICIKHRSYMTISLLHGGRACELFPSFTHFVLPSLSALLPRSHTGNHKQHTGAPADYWGPGKDEPDGKHDRGS